MTPPWCEVKQNPQHISVCGNAIEVTNCRQVRFLGVNSHLHHELGKQLGLELPAGHALCFLQDQAFRLRPLHLHRRFQAFENRQMGLWWGAFSGFMELFFQMEQCRHLRAVPTRLQAHISHSYPEFGLPGRCDSGSHRQVYHVDSSPGSEAHCRNRV